MERSQGAVGVRHPIARHFVASEISDRYGERWHIAFYATDAETDEIIAYLGAVMGMN